MLLPNERHQPMTTPSYKISGLYDGVVEKIDDPLQAGRMKVRVYQIHGTPGNISTSNLPWAQPCFTYPIQIGVPPIGTRVWIAFRQGIRDYPVVLGICHRVNNGISSVPDVGKFPDNQPWNRVLKTPNGKTLELNDNPSNPYIKLYDEHGNVIQIDLNTDKITVNALGDIIINAGGKIEITAAAEIDITSGAPMTIHSGGPLDVTAIGIANITATGLLTLKGAQVIINP